MSRGPAITVVANCTLWTVGDDARLVGPDLPLGDTRFGDEDAVWWELRVRAAYYNGLGYPVEIRVTDANPAWLLTQTRALGGW